MEQVWFVAFCWVVLALVASLISLRIGVSVALMEIVVGTFGGKAPIFLGNKILAHRLRMMAFTLLTPFFFLKAGVMISFKAAWAGIGLILILLGVKIIAKFIGVWPITRIFRFGQREGMYTTLLMSTGLTFGTISSLYGLSHNLITLEQYTILVTAVILSAVVPTLIAERWFDPGELLREERKAFLNGKGEPMNMTVPNGDPSLTGKGEKYVSQDPRRQ